MTKLFRTAILFATALCFFSIISIAQSSDSRFLVEGQVYCDTCRAQFVTRISELMPDAEVRLECRDRVGGQITYSIEGKTDEKGRYSLEVDGEHEEEICEVSLLKSSKPDCDEISQEGWSKGSSRVTLTANDGMALPVRLSNPLGFLKKEALPECPEVFKELTYLPQP